MLKPNTIHWDKFQDKHASENSLTETAECLYHRVWMHCHFCNPYPRPFDCYNVKFVGLYGNMTCMGFIFAREA